MEHDWITDRRPTGADGDEDGDVFVRTRPHQESCTYVHWSLVSAGTPWKPRSPAPAAPAPKPVDAKPAIAVGQRWRRRDGEVVTIDAFIRHDHACGKTHPFVADGTCTYTADGIWSLDGEPTEYDLTELISEADPQPKPPSTTPRKFVALTRTVWMDGGGSQAHTLDAIADDGTAWWRAAGGITWTQLLPLPAREVQADA